LEEGTLVAHRHKKAGTVVDNHFWDSTGCVCNDWKPRSHRLEDSVGAHIHVGWHGEDIAVGEKPLNRPITWHDLTVYPDSVARGDLVVCDEM
jgi:hypothetical protein